MKFYLLAICFIVMVAAFNWHLFNTKIDVSIIEPSDVNLATPKFNVDNTDGFQQPSTFSQTFARPIFSPTRRPYVEPVIEPEIPKPVEDIVVDMPEEIVPSEPIDVVVLGIQSTPTGSQALVRGNGTGEVVWVAVDESFDGWVLTDVSATSVRFTKGEQSQDVLMYSDDGQVGQ